MSILTSLIGPATELLDKVIADKDEKNRIAFELSTMADRHIQEQLQGQLEINKAEARGNWFQSSWRPLAGYTCVLGLMVNFLIAPIAAGFGVAIPQADSGVMMPLLLGLLGLSGGRSFERVKGVSK